MTAFQRVCLPALRNAGELHGIAPGSRRVVAAGKALTMTSSDELDEPAAREATAPPPPFRVDLRPDRHAAVVATVSVGAARPEQASASGTRVFTRLLDRARSMFK